MRLYARSRLRYRAGAYGGANRILLEKDGLGGEVQAINAQLTAVVRQAAESGLTGRLASGRPACGGAIWGYAGNRADCGVRWSRPKPYGTPAVTCCCARG